VSGHYTLLGNQWSWVNGAWTVPPAPGAIWINGRYDAATRRWTEGYWDFSGSVTGARTSR